MDKLESFIKQWKAKESKSKINLSSTCKNDQLIEQVLNVLTDLKANLSELIKHGEQNDLNLDLKFNGFRSFVKVTSKALDRIEPDLTKECKKVELNEQVLHKNLLFLKFMNKLNKIVLDTHDKNQTLLKEDVNQNKKEFQLLFDEKMTVDVFETYYSMKEDLQVYFDGFLSFYLNKHVNLLVKAVCTLIILVSCLPFSLFAVFSKKQTLNVISSALIDSTITWPGCVEVVNNPFVTSLMNMLSTFKNGVQSRIIFLPKQKKWLLKSFDEANLDRMDKLFDYNQDSQTDKKSSSKFKSQDLKKTGIRVKLIHHKSKPKDGILMFHVHGGAFIYHSPDCHELYLQRFVEKIPNLYILSVDYTLREKYGKAHQDVLDVFLWLTSNSPDVEELLGFKPKKIMVCGDSAGAFLSFTLVKMLKDIQKYIYEKKLNETIHLPELIVNFYGFATLNKSSPSTILSFIESIVTLPILRLGFGSLIFGCNKPNLARRIFLPFKSDPEETQQWYISTNANRKDYDQKFVESIQKHPYLEPIDHVDFEEFKDIPLYLITCEYDVFLDANIELAKKWKGPVKLQVFEDLSHGFLQFSVIDPVSKKAVDHSIELIKEAIDKFDF